MPGIVRGHELPRDFKKCSCGKESGDECCDPYRDEGDKLNEKIWCDDKEKCYGPNKGCHCNLFKAPKDNPKANWEFVAYADNKTPKPSDLDKYEYVCICTERVWETKSVSMTVLRDIGRLLNDLLIDQSEG